MNNRRFYSFPRITVAVYFKSIIVYRGTSRARCLSEKAYNFRVREFSAVTFVWRSVVPLWVVHRHVKNFVNNVVLVK